MKTRKRRNSPRAASKAPSVGPGAVAHWEPAAGREPITRREATLVALLVVAGAGLRFAFRGRISIEHWDEAVYSSNLFITGGYPFRHLYAPPLLPAIIEWSMVLFGPGSFSAVLPNLLLGSLTVPLCWWVAREWFGAAAGLTAASLAALSDFHILFSRTALTDPALCFWFLLAVYFIWRALARNRHSEAIVAGLAIGAAWSTKYNGWLPLAVASSAFVAWGIFDRFQRREWTARLPVLATIFIVASICWIPVWLSLPGGYAPVAANHAKYFVGWSGWGRSLSRQLASQRHFNGWLSCSGVGLGILATAVVWWRRLGGLFSDSRFESVAVWILTAGSALLLAAGVGTGVVFALLSLMLIPRIWRRRRERASSPESRFRSLAEWLVLAWFFGLLIFTPLYTPYPRLVLPWLVATWLGASAGATEWFRPFLIVEKSDSEPMPTTRPARWQKIVRLVLVVMVLAGSATLGRRFQMPAGMPGWQDRTVRGKLIDQAGKMASQSFGGQSPSKPTLILTYGEPAIFFHLVADGSGRFDPRPLGDLALLAPGKPGIPPSTFLMAYGTPEFDSLAAPYLGRLELLALFHDTPSDIVLLDTYQPTELEKSKNRPYEELRLYRVKSP